MTEEYYHVGRANAAERLRSARLQPLLERAVSALVRGGFTRDEAVSFIAGLAYDHQEHDHYANPTLARNAVIGVLSGYRNARAFGLDCIVAALRDIAELVGQQA